MRRMTRVMIGGVLGLVLGGLIIAWHRSHWLDASHLVDTGSLDLWLDISAMILQDTPALGIILPIMLVWAILGWLFRTVTIRK